MSSPSFLEFATTWLVVILAWWAFLHGLGCLTCFVARGGCGAGWFHRRAMRLYNRVGHVLLDLLYSLACWAGRGLAAGARWLDRRTR